MFTVNEIIKATGGRCLNHPAIKEVTGVSTDSRTVKSGAIFIAIPGERYDGHDFIAKALAEGASGVIIASKKINYAKKRFGFDFRSADNRIFVAVDDTVTALGDLARLHRERFDIPVVAITGSNGKTTAKEMIYTALKTKWRPLKNSGTENNLIGVPHTLLKLQDTYDSLVVELGMSRIGEIKRLAEISRPNIGIITNIGPSHLQYLRDLSGVYAAKKELLDFLKRGDIAILNGDDFILRSFGRKTLKAVRFGIENNSDFRAESIKHEGRNWSFRVSGTTFLIKSASHHDIYNALAAISIGALFGIRLARISEALCGYVSLDKRMVRSIIEGIEFIDDTYNSNPLSMSSAIATLSSYNSKGSKVLVSGDMLELGRKSAYYHGEMGRLVADSGIDKFISVGKLARNSFLAAKKSGMQNIWFCRTKKEAASVLKKIVKPDDVVLVKGSRGMRMEEVIKCFTISYIP
ncbi:MAG: UDP-N-acetylmuramoyl-tripeptide--D-alanyl-D-alanine ligase [Candidatus Omnitrophica bacterium]|nr:UDP-N-acetylmuramoyl-tripeptide--D-alanyl-D-alanine ligase [Candidatus Omnitrophota bacterium]MBU4488623.1 UDP-N-acetylmuramoyl-tripeptide--D-alanyl-D-alanine ligase [Candidatus Omnitrophota bacterium]MCG2705898.1 UDP-N-acetylmuramoyl-tripeptide--D-alanyl-D-alanine ligase [Candidatus Omnitrophota bacterium]